MSSTNQNISLLSQIVSFINRNPLRSLLYATALVFACGAICASVVFSVPTLIGIGLNTFLGKLLASSLTIVSHIALGFGIKKYAKSYPNKHKIELENFADHEEKKSILPAELSQQSQMRQVKSEPNLRALLNQSKTTLPQGINNECSTEKRSRAQSNSEDLLRHPIDHQLSYSNSSTPVLHSQDKRSTSHNPQAYTSPQPIDDESSASKQSRSISSSEDNILTDLRRDSFSSFGSVGSFNGPILLDGGDSPDLPSRKLSGFSFAFVTQNDEVTKPCDTLAAVNLSVDSIEAPWIES